MSIRTHIGPRKGMLARSRMYVYYVGMVGVGLLGFTGDAPPGVTEALGYKGQPGAPAGMLVYDVELLQVMR